MLQLLRRESMPPDWSLIPNIYFQRILNVSLGKHSFAQKLFLLASLLLFLLVIWCVKSVGIVFAG